MAYDDLLTDTCTIQIRTVNTSGKTDTESFTDVTGVRCRLLKRSSVKGNVEKAMYATVVSARTSSLSRAIFLPCP